MLRRRVRRTRKIIIGEEEAAVMAPDDLGAKSHQDVGAMLSANPANTRRTFQAHRILGILDVHSCPDEELRDRLPSPLQETRSEETIRVHQDEVLPGTLDHGA